MEMLNWDSAFFGKRIARLSAAGPSAEVFSRAKLWCEEERVDCLYYLCEGANAGAMQSAQEAGFDAVDVRMTLVRNCAGDQGILPDGIRDWCNSDLPALRSIAAVSHGDTRFYSDGRFDASSCARLYETWITNSCEKGFADVVLVAEKDRCPVGYVTLKVGGDGTASIGLLAVSAESRGRGIGNALVNAAVSRASARGASAINVVTQGNNLSALRLYQRAGFAVSAVDVWFHYWPRG
jgi:dTDP-4-amino-4,6-dideoxy-D-galactose acyltransferase